MSGVLAGLRALGPARLATLGAVAFAMFALLAVLVLRGPSDQLALLYADLDLREAGQIVELLDRQKIPHKLAASGTQILVAADDVPRARMLLAKEGLPTGGSIGNELLDRGDNLTATQFQQGLNQSRALEGELARTIRSIRGVRTARVHLVLPRREPFSREPQEAQASVLLSLTAGTRLDGQETAAIVNLIAAAVPGLKPQNVAVTDSQGKLLARAGAPSSAEQHLVSQDALKVLNEQRLSRAVEDMLALSLGPNRARAETTLVYDYEQLRETQERYDPDGQVVRSTQTVTNNSKSTETASSVTVQNNLPNADSGATPSGTQEQRQEETTNYEITKTVRTIIRDQPKIARMSMAVMVDGQVQRQADGSNIWQERRPEELAQISRLVRTAIGFDERRGDVIEVVSLRFAGPTDPSDERATGQLPFGLEKPDLVRMANTLLVGLLALAAGLLIVRPMVARLSLAPEQSSAASAAQPPQLSAGIGSKIGHDNPGVSGALGTSSAIAGLLPPPGMPMAANQSDDGAMTRIANIEGQLQASSLRKISDLVDRHPDESLSIIRAWMHQEPA